MATLGQLKTALVNANKAGDMDAVRRLAPIIKAEQERNAPFAGIPTDEHYNPDNALVAGTTPGPPPTSVGEKALGTGETALTMATGATTGTLGMLGGMLKGMADNILSGKYGTQEGVDLVAKSAEEGASALTYAPRTQTGQQQTAKIGEVMQHAAPLIAMAPELGVIGEAASAARPVTRAAMHDAAATAKAAVAERTAPIAQAATELAQQVKAKITPEIAATPGTGKSVGAAAIDQATLRQAAAQELPVPIKLTEGQKTRAFEQQRFERETAKQGDIGEPIRQRFQEQNLKLQQNMDAFIDSTGAELTDVRGVGEIVDKALRSRAARDKTKIRSLYKEAEKAGELEARVPMDSVNKLLDESSSAETLAPVIGATRKELERLGALNYFGRGKGVNLKLGDAENLRRFVTKVAGQDKTNLKYANEIKAAIDAATEGKGGDKYKQARAAYAQSMADYENFGLAKQLLKSKRGSTDRMVALEDVLRKSIISPAADVDSVTKLKSLLQTEGPTGQQAWKELQGGMLRHVRDEALKGVSRDSAGNQIVSASGLDRVVTQLDKTGKLDLVLGKKQAEQIRTINEVAKDVMTSPPGAVNTSNTATVLAGLLDVAISGTTGVPAPVATVFNQVTSRIKDAKLRARVKQSLGE